MSVKPSTPLHPSPGMHPVKDAQHAHDAAALTAAAAAAKAAQAMGATKLTSLASFHELAGVPHGYDPAARQVRPQPQPNAAAAGQRGAAPRPGTTRPRGAAGFQPAPGSKQEQDEDNVLGKAASNFLRGFGKDDQASQEQNLKDQYDPLERYRILKEALKQLDGEPQSDEDKAPPRKQIRCLLDDLEKEHGRDIRDGLEATGDMHELLRSLGEASVNAVRGWFGTAAQGRVHAPLTPIDLAIRLKDAFGAGQFSEALSRLGQTMAQPLSARNQRIAGEPPLMALSDIRAFTTVRSCHAKAQELKRELAENNVAVRDGQGPMDLTDLAIMLMRMASGGKEQAMKLAEEIVDMKNLSTRQQSRAWGCVRKVLAELPSSLWPQDASTKAGLMADLGDRIREQDAMAPRIAPTEAGRREAELRERNAKRAAASKSTGS